MTNCDLSCESHTRRRLIENEGRTHNQILLTYEAAMWEYEYAHKFEDSIRFWQRVCALLVDNHKDLPQPFLASFRTEAVVYLSIIYFHGAKAMHATGEGASAHLSNIENIAQCQQGSKKYYRASYPALVLGLWLHEYEKADEAAWRACITPSIKEALYLLSGNDP